MPTAVAETVIIDPAKKQNKMPLAKLLPLSVSLSFARVWYKSISRESFISKTFYPDEAIKDQDQHKRL